MFRSMALINLIITGINMLIAFLLISVGFVLLMWGADKFVEGASALAANWGVSPLLIGLTIVSLGTSAPEIVVSIAAALRDNAALAIGNVIGSNIANIGLVLGIAAVVSPMKVNSTTLRREYPILFLIMLLVAFVLSDGILSRGDGLVLLAALAAFMAWLIVVGRQSQQVDPMAEEFLAEIPLGLSTKKAIGWLLLGVTLLPLGSQCIVRGAEIIARSFGLSELLIGLTIVAIGTSLPEVAATITAARKQEHDIAMGNIIGSNIFNLVAVLPFPGLLNPGPISASVLTRDLPVMFGITLLLFLVAYGFRKPGTVKRWEGLLLLLCYTTYLTFLVVSATA